MTAGNDVTLTAGENAELAAVMANDGNADLEAALQLILNGDVDATDQVLLTAGGGMNVAGDATAGAEVIADAGEDIAATGALTGGTSVTVTAGGNADLAVVDAQNGDADLTAGLNLVLNGTVDATDSVNLMSGGGTVVNDAVTAGIDITGEAGEDFVTAEAGDLSADSDISIAASGNVEAEGDLVAGGSVMVDAGQDAVLAMMTSGGAEGDDITVTAGQDAVLNGPADAAGEEDPDGVDGDIEVTAGNDLITGADGVLTAENILLTAQTGTITTGAAVTADTDAALDAGENIGAGAEITAVAGDITLLSGGDTLMNGNALTAGNAVMVDAGQDATLAEITCQADSTLTAGQDLVLGGDIVSGTGNITATAGDDLTQNGDVNSGDLVLLAETGSVETTGAVTCVNYTADAADGLAIGGNVTATGTLNAGRNVKSTGDVVIDGDLNVTGAAAIAGGADVVLNGDVTSATAAVEVSANDNLNINGDVTAELDANLKTMTGDVMVEGEVASLTANAVVNSGKDIGGSGILVAENGMAQLTAAGKIGTAADHLDVDTPDVDAQTAEDDGGAINLALESSNGNVIDVRAVTEGEDAHISIESEEGDALNLNVVTAQNGDVMVTADAAINVGQVDAADANADAESKFNGLFNDAHSVSLATSGGDINFDWTDTAGGHVDGVVRADADVALSNTGAGSINLGELSVQAGNDVTVMIETGNLVDIDVSPVWNIVAENDTNLEVGGIIGSLGNPVEVKTGGKLIVTAMEKYIIAEMDGDLLNILHIDNDWRPAHFFSQLPKEYGGQYPVFTLDRPLTFPHSVVLNNQNYPEVPVIELINTGRVQVKGLDVIKEVDVNILLEQDSEFYMEGPVKQKSGAAMEDEDSPARDNLAVNM